MRKRTLLALIAVPLVVASPVAAHAHADPSRRVLLIVLPEDEARASISARGAALALGVDPRSRRATRFVEMVGGPTGGVSRMRGSLERSGIGTAVGAAPEAPPALVAAVERGFGGPVIPVEEALRAPVTILVLDRADQVPAEADDDRTLTLVLGVGLRTPVLVAWPGRGGTLRAGDRPRPGIALAADVRATMLRGAGVRSTGSALSPTAGSTSLASLDRLTRRFSRDDAGRYALSVSLSAALFAPLALALLARRSRASGIVARLAHASALAPAGYLAALFLAEAPKSVRILPIFAVVVVGAFLPPSRSTTRAVGAALLAVASALAVGAVVAPFRPAAEPALTLWGSPLELNRSWGLVNSLAALMGGGLVAGWSFARLPDAVLVVGGLVAAGVCGAAAVGANFVAPLWIIVAVWVGVVARRQGRVRVRDLLAAVIAGAAAFALALFASPAGPASHGSVAAERIFDRGLRAVWDLTRARIGVNVHQFTGRGAWFVVWTVVMTIGLVVALRTGLRAREQPDTARPAFAGAVGLAAGALAALMTEDTGVLVAPIMAAIAGAIWLHHRATTSDVADPIGVSGSGRGDAPGR